MYTCNSEECLETANLFKQLYDNQIEVIADSYEYKETRPIINSDNIKNLYPSFIIDEYLDKERYIQYYWETPMKVRKNIKRESNKLQLNLKK